MKSLPFLTLQIPYSDRSDKYFSFKLKQYLNNEPAEYNSVSKLFVISDIEGDFLVFQKLLVKSKVIDRKHRWVFGDGHLVILGDCFDRGNQVIECLWLIYSLEEKAKEAGGYVHFILGNHEIMNINGDWRYVHPKYANPIKAKRPLTALYDGNNRLWQWLLTKNIIERIGELLFVHGGIAHEINGFNLSITEINKKVRPYYTAAQQSFSDPLLKVVFNSDDSPFWYRGYYKGTATEDQIDVTLSKFKLARVITGHTLMQKITTFFNGKVININTNHSTGKSEGLLIEDGIYFRVNCAGKKKLLK